MRVSMTLPGPFRRALAGTGLSGMSRPLLWRLLILAGIVFVITCSHYTVTISQHHYHDIFRRLYYLPIVLGGLWFQLRGGMATAILVSLIYAPHVVLQWGAHPDAQWDQYLEILLYNIFGLLTGLLSRRELQQRQALERSSDQLDQSYRQLKEQASQMLMFEEQLLRASRLSALGELSAGLAHEIRNPLGSIRGTAEIIRDPGTGAEQRGEFADILVREVDRLNHVVTNFLRFAHPAPVGKQQTCLNRVVDELLDFSAAEHRRQKIVVSFERAELPEVPVDADQLKQVLLNITLNAVQAMPNGGELHIVTRNEAGQVVVQVTDSGPGIAPEVLPRIFNPFYTTRHTGSGLGLAISQRIIQAHGGQIGVRNRPGAGASFEVVLPVGN